MPVYKPYVDYREYPGLKTDAEIHMNGIVEMNLGGDATGDLHYRGSDGFLHRLGVGAGAQVLGIATGLPAWVAPGAGAASISSITLSTPNVLYTNPVSFGVLAGAWTGTLSFKTQSHGLVLASDAITDGLTPTMRALALSDLPTIPSSKTSGFATVATSGQYTDLVGRIINTDGLVEGVSNLYYLNSRVRLAMTLTTTGSSGAATYNNATGAWNIPIYSGTITTVFGRSGAVVAVAGDYSFSQIGALPTTLAGYGITDATSNARAAITLTTIGTSGAATYNPVTGAMNIPTPAGGGGAVTAVNNIDGTLTIAPNTGNVVASLNLAHANTWTGIPSFNGTSNASTGIVSNLFTLYPTINNTGASGYIALKLSAYQQSVGTGVTTLLDIGTNTAANGLGVHTTKYLVDASGNTTVSGFMTVAGLITGASLVVNGALDSSSVFTVNSTTKGSIAFPKMTTVQRTSIVTPGNGLMAYDTTTSTPYYYNGSVWVPFGSGGGAVTSVFTRTGVVVAATGDYTAAQVTNAVDQTASYTNPVWLVSIPYTKVTGAPWLLANQSITLSGDTTGSGAVSIATTIAPNVVTNAKLAVMPAHTHKGNNTAGSANPIDLTTTQLTAELNVFTTALNGLVPAPITFNTTDFLRRDGVWATPSVSGTVTLNQYQIGVGNVSNVLSGSAALQFNGVTFNLGNTASSSGTSPVNIDLGGTFSSAAGANLKIAVYNDGSSKWGFGISSNQLDYVVTTGGAHVWYVAGAEKLRITGSNLSTSNAVQFSNLAGHGVGVVAVDNSGNLSWLATPSGGGGITSLTTDVTASGSGAVAATVVGLRSVALPALSVGNLRYTGSNWTFDSNNYLTANQSIVVTTTGDVTGSGSGITSISYPTTIAANAVTYGKFQQMVAFSLHGNPTAVGASTQAITLGAGLSFSGTTLVNTIPATLAPLNQVLYGTGSSYSSGANLTYDGAQLKINAGNVSALNTFSNSTTGGAVVLGNATYNHTAAISYLPGYTHGTASYTTTYNFSVGETVPNSVIYSGTFLNVNIGSPVNSVVAFSAGVASRRSLDVLGMEATLIGSSVGIASTISDLAAIHVYPVYQAAGVLNSIKITNYYGLLLGNSVDSIHVAGTITNSYGIYQEGPGDRNYLAGDLVLNKIKGTTTQYLFIDNTGLVFAGSPSSGAMEVVYTGSTTSNTPTGIGTFPTALGEAGTYQLDVVGISNTGITFLQSCRVGYYNITLGGLVTNNATTLFGDTGGGSGYLVISTTLGTITVQGPAGIPCIWMARLRKVSVNGGA